MSLTPRLRCRQDGPHAARRGCRTSSCREAVPSAIQCRRPYAGYRPFFLQHGRMPRGPGMERKARSPGPFRAAVSCSAAATAQALHAALFTGRGKACRDSPAPAACCAIALYTAGHPALPYGPVAAQPGRPHVYNLIPNRYVFVIRNKILILL